MPTGTCRGRAGAGVPVAGRPALPARKGLAPLCCLLLLSCAVLPPTFSQGDTTPMPPQVNAALAAGQRPVKIVGFGDSITGVYYHTGGRRAWPEMLGLALQRAYPQAQVQVVNAGVSGGNTTSGLARIDQDVLRHQPDLVVVMFGMNDIVANVPATYEANLRTIVAKCRDAGAEVVLCTPNTIYDQDANRPLARLSSYADIVRRLGKELALPVADCFSAFGAVEKLDAREWARLMSDTIHPNMRGHKLFAEEMTRAIAGRDVSLSDIGPLPGLPHVRARLQEGKPLRILAMPPYDTLIGPALKSLFPPAQCEIVKWETVGQSVAQLEAAAKAQGWMALRDRPERPRPDLVVFAIPASADAPDFERFYRSYTWVLNWSLSFGVAEWDAFAVLPELAQPQLPEADRERAAWALQVVEGQDIPYLTRPEGNRQEAAELLGEWLRRQLRP